MRIYSVHQRSAGLDLDLVRDGWSWAALLFGPMWLVRHRMWWELAGFVAIIAAVSLGFTLLGTNEAVQSLAMMLPSIGLAVGGNDLRRAALRRKGYEECGLVSGDSLDDCEDRYLGLLRDREHGSTASGATP